MPIHLTVSTSPAPIASAGLHPLDALQTIAESRADDFVLLHSGPANGFSVLGYDPLCRVMVDAAGVATVRADASLAGELPAALDGAEPLAALQQVIDSVTFEPPHPLVAWLGFLSYDIGRFLETIPARSTDDLRWPVLAFTLFRHYLLFDAAAGSATACTLGRGDSPAPADLTALLQRRPPDTSSPKIAPPRLIERQAASDFEAKVSRIKQYIAAGDIYQANLAQRWIFQTAAQPHALFRRLCAETPAPYSACIRCNDGHSVRHVLSASPELFLSLQDGRAVTRPIKGTRPRDLHDARRDAALRDELIASPKDHAELTMIVDLLRNDLGRVSRYGSVNVADARAIEQHPTVWHTAATILSEIRPDATLSQILAAMSPGGSITGAPKIRAMQIIEELEGFRRGLYCGNIGAIGPRGKSLALNIAIRTILMRDDHALLYAGGGIVADSDPRHEYEETLHKAAAMLRAIGAQPSALE